MTTCPECGKELQVSDWPFCPHGRGSFTVSPDSIPGGVWRENGFSQPRKFYSHSEHKAALALEGCELAPRHVDGSKHLSRWTGINLDAAEALVERIYGRGLRLLDPPSVAIRVEDGTPE